MSIRYLDQSKALAAAAAAAEAAMSVDAIQTQAKGADPAYLE